MTSPETPPQAAETPAAAPKPRRRWLARTFVVIASLLAFLAIFSIWIDRQLLNTENWTASSSQMLESPAVRTQLAQYLTDQIYANVDVEGELRSALPPRLQPLAGPAAGLLRTQINKQALAALERPKTQELWENANRQAHLLLLKTLEGGGPIVSTKNDAVTVDLKALLAETEARSGIGGRLGKVLPADAAKITVLQSDQLGTAQTIFSILRPLPVVLVVLSLVFFGLALIVAPGYRRNVVRGYGIGYVVSGLLALVGVRWLGNEVVGLARTEAAIPAIQDIWEIYSKLLKAIAWAAVSYGVVMIFGAWLAGPTRAATATRRVTAPYLREPIIAFSVLAVIVGIVFLWWQPTPATRNPVTAILMIALLALGVEGLRRQTSREFPGADRRAAMDRWRERFSGLGASVSEKARSGADAVSRKASDLKASIARPRRPTMRSGIAQLERLMNLKTSGVLDEEEFKREKSRILAGAADEHPTAPL